MPLIDRSTERNPLSDMVIDIVWRVWSNAKAETAKGWRFITIDRRLGFWSEEECNTPWEAIELEAYPKSSDPEYNYLMPTYHLKVAINHVEKTLDWSLLRERFADDDWDGVHAEKHNLDGLSTADIFMLAERVAAEALERLRKAQQDHEVEYGTAAEA